MEGHRRGGCVVVGGDARQRLYDARGYGRPREGNEVALAPVEAAHLLFRGDLAAVDGEDFAAFFGAALADAPNVGARFAVYADLRARGFYLSPAREGWVEKPRGDVDFVVYRRGSGPAEGAVEHRVRVVGERTTVPARELGDVVLAVADEEGEVTYFETATPEIEGSSAFEPPSVDGALLADRAVVWAPPADLYGRGFYGQPLGGRDAGDGPLQLSLVEAAYLAREGALDVDPDAAAERGRAVAGERFDRRLAVYAALRERGVVPKTGFKFGADFRTYADVKSVDDLPHSETLVRVLPGDYALTPRELALDVRMAHGVRKRMVLAPVGADGIEWRSAARLTP